MVNEGAKILEEGMAQRASDIDVVWVYGYGWPVYRGGPMFWADTVGPGQDRRGPEAPGRADEAGLQLLEAAARQGGEGRELYALGAALLWQQAKHRERHRCDSRAGRESGRAAAPIP